MTNENMALWQSVEKTDPAHVNPIAGKSYKGDSPKPYWLVKRATETFGPCGIGWGFDIVDEMIVEGANGEKISLAKVRVWYSWGGKRGEVEHVGGTPFSGHRKSGEPFNDEDAPKKSVTDALTKALSMIGFAGDIFIGHWNDSKYQAELREEFSNRVPAPPLPQGKGSIQFTSGVSSLAKAAFIANATEYFKKCPDRERLIGWWNNTSNVATMTKLFPEGKKDPEYVSLRSAWEEKGKALASEKLKTDLKASVGLEGFRKSLEGCETLEKFNDVAEDFLKVNFPKGDEPQEVTDLIRKISQKYEEVDE